MRHSNRTPALVAVLVLAGLCLRFAYTARSFVITPDSVEYLQAARALHSSGPSALKSTPRQPLYPAFLWAAARAAAFLNPSFQWRPASMEQVGRWLGLALHLPFLLAAYLFFLRAAGPSLAPWCLAVVIVHPLFGFYFANVMSETLYLTFFLLGLWALMAAGPALCSPTRAALWALAAGVFAGLAYLVRTEGQVLVIAGLSLALASSLAAALRKDRRPALAGLASAGALAAGYAAMWAPFALYLGATARRYPWEWLWHKMASGGPVAAQQPLDVPLVMPAGLAAQPTQAAATVFSQFFSHAPIISGVFLIAVAAQLVARLRRREFISLPPAYQAVSVTFGWYLLALVAGVSIQTGLVSQRYLQPFALMMLPVAAAAVAAPLSRFRSTAVVARAAFVVALLAAFATAAHEWSSYKVGHRQTGLALSCLAAGRPANVLTANPRVAFYADSGPHLADYEDLRQTVLAGGAAPFDYVVLETKRGGFDQLHAALSSSGFAEVPACSFPEDTRAAHRADQLIVYARKT